MKTIPPAGFKNALCVLDLTPYRHSVHNLLAPDPYTSCKGQVRSPQETPSRDQPGTLLNTCIRADATCIALSLSIVGSAGNLSFARLQLLLGQAPHHCRMLPDLMAVWYTGHRKKRPMTLGQVP